jgi:catechol 2,3-dioxygenase-like lactoylglutathione lyase family enzyme
MIHGAHAILYSTDAEADRAFFRDVLGLPNVDVGDGWLIFGLPPAEVAVHPASEGNVHELYLMCSDIAVFVAGVEARGVVCEPIRDMGWGRLTQVTLPSGGKIGVYEPRHSRPAPAAS